MDTKSILPPSSDDIWDLGSVIVERYEKRVRKVRIDNLRLVIIRWDGDRIYDHRFEIKTGWWFWQWTKLPKKHGPWWTKTRELLKKFIDETKELEKQKRSMLEAKLMAPFLPPPEKPKPNRFQRMLWK